MIRNKCNKNCTLYCQIKVPHPIANKRIQIFSRLDLGGVCIDQVPWHAVEQVLLKYVYHKDNGDYDDANENT